MLHRDGIKYQLYSTYIALLKTGKGSTLTLHKAMGISLAIYYKNTSWTELLLKLKKRNISINGYILLGDTTTNRSVCI